MGKNGRSYHLEDGYTLKAESNGYWAVFWNERDEKAGRTRDKRISTRSTELAEATEIARGIITQRRHQVTARQVITCGEVIEGYKVYLRQHGKHASNLPILEVLQRFWRDVPIGDVDGAMQRRYEHERRQGKHAFTPVRLAARHVSDATLSREIVSLKSACSWAIKAGLLKESDRFHLTPLPSSAPRPPTLTADEAEDLMQLAAGTSIGKPRLTRLHRWLWIAIITGARCEAVENLRWEQVDFTKGGTGWIDFNTPGRRKTKKVRPEQPISPRLLPLLRQAYAERINDWVLDNNGSMEFSWRRFRDTSPWANADLHRHDLRAVAITTALDKGMPTAKASLFFGVTIGVIERKYLRARHSNFLDDVGAYI